MISGSIQKSSFMSLFRNRSTSASIPRLIPYFPGELRNFQTIKKSSFIIPTLNYSNSYF